MPRIFVGLISCLCLIFNTLEAKAQDKAPFTELLSIGDSVDGEAEYIFRDPQHLVTDREGNIYLSDKGIPTIKVYSKKGKFLREIGRRGRGPGEFQEVSMLAIDKGTLIVFDNISQRFTKLGLDGEVIKTSSSPFGGGDYILVKAIYPLRNNSYLTVLARQSSSKDNVFVVLDSNFENKISEFGQSKDIWDFSKPFLASQAASRALNTWKSKDKDHIVLSTEIYQPNSFLYTYYDNKWRKKELNGFNPTVDSYTLLDHSKRKSPPGNTIVYSGREGKFVSQIHHKSIGIFIHENKILNFFIATNDRSSELKVDVFDLQGSYVGHQTLMEFSSIPLFSLEFMWKDDEGKFYLSDRRKNPHIKVLKFNNDVL